MWYMPSLKIIVPYIMSIFTLAQWLDEQAKLHIVLMEK